jgi:hypothetical protein
MTENSVIEKNPNEYKHTNTGDLTFFDFGIKEIPFNYNHEGINHSVPDKRIIINTQSGEYMGDVGNKYKLQPHKLVMSNFHQHLQKANVDLSDVSITDSKFENGAKAIRTIIWNNIFANVGTKSKEDLVRMRLDVCNSVNGQWSFQAFVGAYRDFCLNTLVFGGERWYHEKLKHTAGINTYTSAEKCVKTISLFNERMEDLKKWRHIQVEDEWVFNFFKNTIAKRMRRSKIATKFSTSSDFSERLVDYLTYRYECEIKSLGRTAFAVYMAITHYCSHLQESYERDVKQANGGFKTIEYKTFKEGSKTHNVERDRRNKVSESLSSDIWLCILKPKKNEDDLKLLLAK